MRRNPYTIRMGYVKCIKSFSMKEDYFIKGELYRYCFDDSTVCGPNSGYYKYIGLSYPTLFRRANVFDVIQIIIKSLYNSLKRKK